MRVTYFSFKYKLIRFLAKTIVYAFQLITFQKKDLETVVNIGKASISILLKTPVRFMTQFSVSPKLAVNIYGLKFASPITFAAYEAHLPLLELFFRIGIGGGCIKTMMVEPQKGNKRPRLQQIKIDNQWSLINALGLPGKGINTMSKLLKGSKLFDFNRAIGLSIGGHHCDEYKAALNQYESHFSNNKNMYYEINISCPNTQEGQDLAHNLDLLKDLLIYARDHTTKVISVKLTPDLNDNQLLEIATLISKFDKMIINIGNTTKRRCEEVGLAKNAISIGAGGLSGPTLFNRTFEMVKLLKPLEVPLIATGGIDSVEKIKQCLDAGASLVGMATTLVMDPFQVINFNKKLEENSYVSKSAQG